MWRRAWGALGRAGGAAGGPRGLGEHGLCSSPGGSWFGSRGAGKAALPGRGGARSAHSGFPLDVKVPQEVLLYRFERQQTFVALGFFCVAQAGFWGYLAHLAFSSLHGPGPEVAPGESPEGKKAPRKRIRMPLLEGFEEERSFDKWRIGLTGSCLAAGILIVGAAYLYARRSVSQILLHRGGQAVSFTTYYPFGFTTSFTVPLRQVACLTHRSRARAMIPVKVKDQLFYFLVDKQGQFADVNLFDLTVGAYRKL